MLVEDAKRSNHRRRVHNIPSTESSYHHYSEHTPYVLVTFPALHATTHYRRVPYMAGDAW